MSPSRPVPSAATVPAHPPRRGTAAAKLGLKPPRDSRQELRPKALTKSRPGRADPAASPRHVPSSPLARNVMTFRSTSSGDSNGASKSPLHGIANNRIRKSAASAATGKSADRRHVYSGDTVRIGAPRASKGQRPRAKYQGSPTLPSPSSAGPASSSKPASRTAPACADSRPMYKRKVLEKPKSQPIFKKALANVATLTSMIAKRTTEESKAAILQLPALPSIPTVPNTVSRKPQVQAPAAPIAAPCVAKTNVSHPPPTQLQPQSHPRALQPPVPTHSAFPKHAFVTTWISSQVPFATARADRLTRGIPPPYASGSGCLIHSPLPFAPPMDNLPEIESDVWSAGDLMDMRMKVQPTVPHVPSDQENWRPDEPVVRGIMSKELVVHAIAKQVEPAAQVPDVDMDEAATILGGDCARDIGGQQDDAGSQSSERTVIPEEGGDELYSLPGLVSSEKHISPPKVLARQDSAVMFVPMDVDSPHKAFPVSREYQECPSPLGWAVVPCSDLSMNGLGDEFLQV